MTTELIRKIHEAAGSVGVLADDELPDHIASIVRERGVWLKAIRGAIDRAAYVIEQFPEGHPAMYRGTVNNILALLTAALNGDAWQLEWSEEGGDHYARHHIKVFRSVDRPNEWTWHAAGAQGCDFRYFATANEAMADAEQWWPPFTAAGGR